MKHGLGMSFALLLCTAADAADPPQIALVTKAAPAKAAADKAVPPAPLNLRIGDVRKYMTPNEFLAAINAPDADTTSVVVEGTRTPVAQQSLRPVPTGLGSLWYLARHPTQSWRIFLPDVNAPALGPTVDKVPPPIFRWGP